jgi:O-antigen ligase
MEALAPTRPSREALVLAAAIPFLCLHERYDPDLTFATGTTSVSISLSDIALLAVLVAAVLAARRVGAAPLRAGGWTLMAAGLLLALVVVAVLLGPVLADDYPFATKVVSAAKFVAYGLLVVAVPLIVRRGADALALLTAITATAAVATVVGALQLIGLIGNLDETPAGRRMPSFLGYHDFAALAGVTLGIAIAGIAVGWWSRLRPLFAAAAAAGVIGVIIAGSLANMAALAVGGVLALAAMAAHGALHLRRAAAVCALVGIALAGSLVLRGGDVADFIGFLGSDDVQSTQVETYSQRTVLIYIGLRIFRDHPLTGVGWQGSELPSSFEPYLDDARRRFPDVAAEALPSAERPWGVQNAYVQAAADMGVLGLLAAVGTVLTGIGRALCRTFGAGGARTPYALATATALLVCAAVWAALGLVPGVPATALLWIAIGGAVALPRA